jgi:hypothetical protein
MSEAKEDAREKGIVIIESCTNCDHCEGAKLYLDLYLSQFDDQESYDELILIYEKKKQELNCEKL